MFSNRSNRARASTGSLDTSNIWLPRTLDELWSRDRSHFIHEKGSVVVRVGDGVLLKYRRGELGEEVLCARFARDHLGLPVPRILHHPGSPHRRTPYVEDYPWARAPLPSVWYFCMEEARGIALDKVVEDMTAEQLEHIAVQLRSILARMRAVTSTSLGSVDGGPHRNLPLPGSYLPKHRFGSTRDFVSFLRETLGKKCPPEIADMLFAGMPLNASVHFAHGDLVPKNIMVEGSTITAVIDWEHAAFYPSFWEYCRMHDPGFMTPKWGRILEQVFPGPRRQDEIDSVHRVLTDIYWRHDLFG